MHYKCISKILANRLQGVLPYLIDKTQSAFIKGRSIVDNVLLMQEVVRGYHRDSGSPRCSIKVDLMKAYDSVDWGFLIDTLSAMGFPSIFIQWISQCISTAYYSVIINGSLEGFFPGRRGLRQGDPISPYLFLIVMQGFSEIFKQKASRSNF